VSTLKKANDFAATTKVDGVMSARSLLCNPALFSGYDSCPWEAVEKFLSKAAKAPLPFKLVMHHLTEMCGSSAPSDHGGAGASGALFNKEERIALIGCSNMLEVIDWLDSIRKLRRL
jgi:tRNA-dihydrouridine synthase 4